MTSQRVNSSLNILDHPKVSIFVKILIETLDLDSWKSLSQLVKEVLTLWKWHLDSLDYPKISIFVEILIKTLDLDIWKSLSQHVKNILTVLKIWSRHIKKSRSRSRLVSTVETSKLKSKDHSSCCWYHVVDEILFFHRIQFKSVLYNYKEKSLHQIDKYYPMKILI